MAARKNKISCVYEATHQEFIEDFLSIMRERNLTTKDIAECLGKSVPDTRKIMYKDELSLRDIVELTSALQGTPRILIIFPS